jgi:hypothetical protein
VAVIDSDKLRRVWHGVAEEAIPLTERERLAETIKQDIADYIAAGGVITEVPRGASAWIRPDGTVAKTLSQTHSNRRVAAERRRDDARPAHGGDEKTPQNAAQAATGRQLADVVNRFAERVRKKGEPCRSDS